eukprot:TRINITY_DN3380_c0_g1_i2.p1 TRINITY_DN3380_c0_g1~~TRINITY_DN3380_c0_g1_i2.p1  ORF type:complete len:527 (+),score=102.93 TRINITY_DN3380_c0_g1_i2:85-1665(+)
MGTYVERMPHIRAPSEDIIQECEVCKHSFSLVVLGASGDLAKKKTFPALFKLFCRGLLPPHTDIVGYARSKIGHDDFVDKMREAIKGKATGVCRGKMEKFLSKLHYVSGSYDSVDGFKTLHSKLCALETESLGPRANRLFYFALPPSVYSAAAHNLRSAAWSHTGFNRVILEKPFGRDLASSVELIEDVSSIFKEKEMYRIDHYTGKEMVQNIMVLRFGNRVYKPLWNREHIASVTITMKEPIGTEGRGGYFEHYGIIRDVMQNHLIQVLALIAMERPASLDAEHVRDEKVRVLQRVAPLKLEDVVLGQYVADRAGVNPSYTDDDGVPADSSCPTFATAVFHVNNERWDGVPFIVKCGKALNEKKADIRIQFKPLEHDIFGNYERNELVIRIQPNECIYMKMHTKKPGLSAETIVSELDLSYRERFNVDLPDAYESLILDAIKGDQGNFVRSDELIESWKIFDDVLGRIDRGEVKPDEYEFGTRGPAASDELLKRYGFELQRGYSWVSRGHDPQSPMLEYMPLCPQ